MKIILNYSFYFVLHKLLEKETWLFSPYNTQHCVNFLTEVLLFTQWMKIVKNALRVSPFVCVCVCECVCVRVWECVCVYVCGLILRWNTMVHWPEAGKLEMGLILSAKYLHAPLYNATRWEIVVCVCVCVCVCVW
jgi:hypothetical protein